jgi:hypothetical protein
MLGSPGGGGHNHMVVFKYSSDGKSALDESYKS